MAGILPAFFPNNYLRHLKPIKKLHIVSNPLKVAGSIGFTVPASLAAGEYLLKVVSENNTTIKKIIIW
jgi:hypothetical protein